MWNYTQKDLADYKGFQYQITSINQILSYQQFIDLLINSKDFRLFFNDLLVKCPFKGFFWEVKPIKLSSLNTTFEFVIIESPTLATVIADKKAFEEHFHDEQLVVSFANLRGDARLVVPTPKSIKLFYAHLGNFARNASEKQIDTFWKAVGENYKDAIGENPAWLSTAGLGVYWLHVRIDSRPKYYRYMPYKIADVHQ